MRVKQPYEKGYLSPPLSFIVGLNSVSKKTVMKMTLELNDNISFWVDSMRFNSYRLCGGNISKIIIFQKEGFPLLTLVPYPTPNIQF